MVIMHTGSHSWETVFHLKVLTNLPDWIAQVISLQEMQKFDILFLKAHTVNPWIISLKRFACTLG